MGIKGLFNFIKKKYPSAISKSYITSFSKMKIAIDAETLVYKNKMSKNDTTFQFLFNWVNMFLINGILPIFIFDGSYEPLKKECYKQRHNIREKWSNKIESLEHKLLEASNTHDIYYDETDLAPMIDTIISSHPIVTKEYREECKTFLKSLGLPVLTADYEAEGYCVQLAAMGSVNAIYSEDSDTLVYQDLCVPVINKISGHTCYSIDKAKLLSLMNLDTFQFMNFCILCGCDYTNISYSPTYAYKIIKENLESEIKQISGNIQNLYSQKEQKNHKEVDLGIKQIVENNLANKISILNKFLFSLKQYNIINGTNYKVEYKDINIF